MRMPLRTLALAMSAAAACLYLSSYSSGPANRNNDATSSGLRGSACATCHNGGDYGTATTLELLGADGEAVDAYVPDATYTMRVSIGTTTAPGGYGFHVLAVDADVEQAGAFGTPPEDTRLSELRGRTYFEQRRRLSSAIHEIEWIAPEEGTGEVTVYAVGNAVNANGGTSGDEPNEAIVRFAEASASAVDALAWPQGLRVSSAEAGTIRLWPDTAEAAEYDVDVVAFDGRAVALRRVLAKAPLSFSGLTPGVYIIQLTDGDGAVATRTVPVLR